MKIEKPQSWPQTVDEMRAIQEQLREQVIDVLRGTPQYRLGGNHADERSPRWELGKVPSAIAIAL